MKKARKEVKDKDAPTGGRKVVKEHKVTKEDIVNANKAK